MRMGPILLFSLTLALQGCIYYNYEATPEEIIEYARNEQEKGAVQNLLWYHGRKNGHDYFTYVHGMFAQRRFKVKAGEIEVPQVYEFTTDDTKWMRIKSINNQWEFWVPHERDNKERGHV